jgi:hypothetical protein
MAATEPMEKMESTARTGKTAKMGKMEQTVRRGLPARLVLRDARRRTPSSMRL